MTVPVTKKVYVKPSIQIFLLIYYMNGMVKILLNVYVGDSPMTDGIIRSIIKSLFVGYLIFLVAHYLYFYL